MTQLNYNASARTAAHIFMRAMNDKVTNDRVAKTGALAWQIYEGWTALKRRHPDFVATIDAGRSRVALKATPDPDAPDVFSVFASRWMQGALAQAINGYEKPPTPPVCKHSLELLTADLTTLANGIFMGMGASNDTTECYDVLGLAFADLKAARWNVSVVNDYVQPYRNGLFTLHAYRDGSRAAPTTIPVVRNGGRDTRNEHFVAIAENLVYEFCHASGTPYRMR